MTGSNESGNKTGQDADFRFPIERRLATEEQLRRIEDLAGQFGFVETGNMKSISHAEHTFSDSELPDQAKRWQKAAEEVSAAGLAKEPRNVIRDMRMNLGLQLSLLAITLRQGHLMFAEQILEDIGDLLDEDAHKNNYLADAVPYIEDVLEFVKNLPSGS